MQVFIIFFWMLQNLRASLVNENEVLLPSCVVKSEGLEQPFASVNHLKRLQEFQENGSLKLVAGFERVHHWSIRFSKVSVAEAQVSHEEAKSVFESSWCLSRNASSDPNSSRNLFSLEWFSPPLQYWASQTTSWSTKGTVLPWSSGFPGSCEGPILGAEVSICKLFHIRIWLWLSMS